MNPNTWTKGYELRKRDRSAEITGSERLPAKLPEQHLENTTVTGVTENADSGEIDNNCDLESQRPKDTVCSTKYKGILRFIKAKETVFPMMCKGISRFIKPKDTFRPVKYEEMPPNISLNTHGESNPIELAIYAVIATILQVIVLGWSGFLAFSSFAYRNIFSGSKPLIGFALQAIGTLFLTLGLVLCAGIIDNGCNVQFWSKDGDSQMRTLANDHSANNQSANEKPFNGRDMQLYWIQKQRNVGENSLDPYILYAEELNDKICESHRAEGKSHNYLTNTAVIFGTLRFVVQFQGLRFLNWTCSIAQFFALAIVTFLRARVRRNMTKTPIAIQANNDYILDHLTLALLNRRPSDSEFPNLEAFGSPGLFFAFGVTTIPKLRVIEFEPPFMRKGGHSNRAKLELAKSGSEPPINVQRPNEAKKKLSLAQQALNLRVRLGLIMEWTGPKFQDAIILSNSIETALERLSPTLLFEKKCTVVLQINTFRTMSSVPPTSRPSAQEEIDSLGEDSSQEEVELEIIKDGGKWKVDDAQLEALLSLVSYSTWAAEQNRSQEADEEESSASLESSGHHTKEQSVKNSQSIG